MKKIISVTLSVVLIVAIFCVPFSAYAAETSGNIRVHVLDVGQGDSIFIELPNKQTMLIDSGTADNESYVKTYIKGRGYSKINYLIATHGRRAGNRITPQKIA